jgi:ATP-dependent Clp protease ATP-binding subunit ClpC
MKYLSALRDWLNPERFSVHVKRALKTAEVEAARLGSDCVDTEHLLIGMLVQDDGTAVKILQRLSCDVANVQRQLQGITSTAPRQKKWLPRSAAVIHAIKDAAKEARTTNAPSTGTEHLLLAFMRRPDCRACQVLKANGATLDRVQSEVDAENGRPAKVGQP